MRRGLAALALFLILAGIARAGTNLVGPIQTYSCAIHTWANSLALATGATACTQPAYSDLAGGFDPTAAQLANLINLSILNRTQTIFGPQPNLSASAAAQIENGRVLTNLFEVQRRLYGFTTYISGNWYLIFSNIPFVGGGNTYVAGSIYCGMQYILNSAHINSLAAYVAILGSAGHFQLALYAVGPTGHPNGAPIINTTSMSTAATGAISQTVANTALAAGPIFVCIQSDNGTSAMHAMSASGQLMQGAVIGSTTLGNLLVSGGASMDALVVTGAYSSGSFPTFTTATAWTEDTSASAWVPLVAMFVSSVP